MIFLLSRDTGCVSLAQFQRNRVCSCPTFYICSLLFIFHITFIIMVNICLNYVTTEFIRKCRRNKYTLHSTKYKSTKIWKIKTIKYYNNYYKFIMYKRFRLHKICLIISIIKNLENIQWCKYDLFSPIQEEKIIILYKYSKNSAPIYNETWMLFWI